MQNVVPLPETLADRALADRREQYVDEIRRLIDAAFVVLRRSEHLDPQVREIVREAELSNQAFYRHFASRDALLLAVLADGRRQLVEYLAHRMARADDPTLQLTRFVEGVMAQARNAHAAAATRPFALNGTRLAARFPDAVAASRAELLALLQPLVHALGGDDFAVEFVHDLVMARMNDALVERRVPAPREITRLVAFCLAGVRDGA
ncbi:MAG: TetR/AcrR family transcriptional regulator [Actinomycetota bacterium]